MAEKQIESYGTHLAHSIKGLFVPDWLEILLYSISSAVILCILNYQVFLNNVSTSSEVTEDALNNYLHSKLNRVSTFSGSLFQGRLANMLFWAFVGCLIYMVVWTLQNFVINIRNDVKAAEFVGFENQSSRRRAYWDSVISSKVFFGCSLIALIIYVIALDRFLMPIASKAFGLAISTGFMFPRTIIEIVLSVLGAAILLFALVLLLRVVIRTWRWIIGNF